MALGVTQQLPLEERHIYKREYIADSLVVRLGGRVAEELVFGHQSTGANNDLVGNTELARKMVREWGMSDRIGPMAWGSQGAVFLGDDLMHSRDYSDETARVIDEEVERILREEEDRCRKTLNEYRPGSTRSRRRCSRRRRSTRPRSRISSTRPWAARSAGPGRSSTPTAPRSSRRRPSRTASKNWAERADQPRSSASFAQRSVAVNAPANDARVTPSASTTIVTGAASIA